MGFDFTFALNTVLNVSFQVLPVAGEIISVGLMGIKSRMQLFCDRIIRLCKICFPYTVTTTLSKREIRHTPLQVAKVIEIYPNNCIIVADSSPFSGEKISKYDRDALTTK